MSASSLTFLQSARSPDQSLVAVVPPSAASSSSASNARLLVQVYQVTSSSCQLQLTLTHSPPAPLQELIFCGNSAVLARFGTSQIVLWDLDRGVVSQTLEARDDEEFLGLAAAASNECFYNLTKHGSNKLVVQEYARSTGKLLRKIKSGRWEGESSPTSSLLTLCVSSSHVVVQTAPGSLRVMNSQTGKKLGKIKAGKGDAVVFTSMKLVEGTDMLATIQSGGTILFYNVSSCEESSKKLVHQVASSSGAATALSDGLLQLNDDLKSVLVEGTVFSKKGSSLEQLTTIQSAHPIAPFLTKDDRVLTLVHHNRTGCQPQWVDLEDVAETLDLEKAAAEAAAAASETKDGASAEKAPKRKTTEAMILGPGQAGIEVAPPTKKPKVVEAEEVGSDNDVDIDDEDEDPSANDITIAERLQQLTNALDDEEDEDEDDDMDEEGAASKSNFKPHRATTESLKELLSQALQSGDDSLLELALSVRDPKVISTTLKEIGSPRIVTLVSKLTTRLASNPLRAEGLALWMSHCLKHGKFQPQHLAPLRNLLYERTESFADLLRLEGRLSLMCDTE